MRGHRDGIMMRTRTFALIVTLAYAIGVPLSGLLGALLATLIVTIIK